MGTEFVKYLMGQSDFTLPALMLALTECTASWKIAQPAKLISKCARLRYEEKEECFSDAQ